MAKKKNSFQFLVGRLKMQKLTDARLSIGEVSIPRR